jgi:hypothetical protein
MKNQLDVPVIETVPTVSLHAETHPAISHDRSAAFDNLFPQEEWNQLHSQDKLAATAIVAIMITIFSVGLIGYIAIALVCAGG